MYTYMYTYMCIYLERERKKMSYAYRHINICLYHRIYTCTRGYTKSRYTDNMFYFLQIEGVCL